MNWVYGTVAGVKCPQCGELTEGLDWVLNEAGDTTTGAKVYPCQHVIPMPPWKFGPHGTRGELKFTR